MVVPWVAMMVLYLVGKMVHSKAASLVGLRVVHLGMMKVDAKVVQMVYLMVD